MIGTNPGYSPYHTDENMSYAAALQMINNNNLDPKRYDYPSLIPLISLFSYRLFFMPLKWTKFYLTHISVFKNGLLHFPLNKEEQDRIYFFYIINHEINPLFWTRYITAILGTGVVLLIYLISRALFNKLVAILASLLVAVNYRQVLNSHFGLPDIYNAFFLLLSFWYTLKIWKAPTRKNYLLAIFFVALSFCVKYQIFAIPPFLLVHLLVSLKKRRIREIFKHLFRWEIWLTPFVIAVLFALLDLYHLMNYQKMLDQVSYTALKYGMGVRQLDVYSYAYLYHIGIGEVTSLLCLLGLIFSLIMFFWESVLLLSVVFPFLYVMTYYSYGGFYTRNFVTVTPFILIFGAVFLYGLSRFKYKLTAFSLVGFILVLAVKENLINSVIVVKEYLKPWNYLVLASKMVTLPNNSVIGAHSSVAVDDKFKRVSYDFSTNNSMMELKEAGAQYAVLKLDWLANDTFWWMKRPFKEAIHYWNKPINLLNQSYISMSINELTQSTVFTVIKPWQAPESDYIVVKIPDYRVNNEQIMVNYDFGFGQEGWNQIDDLNYGKSNLVWENGALVFKPNVKSSPIVHWSSPVFSVDNWQGLKIVSSLKIDYPGTSKYKDGYIFVIFYKSMDDARKRVNPLTENLTAKSAKFGEWLDRELIAKVPDNAKFARIGFRLNDAALATAYLRSLKVYKAELSLEDNGPPAFFFKLDPELIFQSSHGGM